MGEGSVERARVGDQEDHDLATNYGSSTGRLALWISSRCITDDASAAELGSKCARHDIGSLWISGGSGNAALRRFAPIEWHVRSLKADVQVSTQLYYF